MCDAMSIQCAFPFECWPNGTPMIIFFDPFCISCPRDRRIIYRREREWMNEWTNERTGNDGDTHRHAYLYIRARCNKMFVSAWTPSTLFRYALKIQSNRKNDDNNNNKMSIKHFLHEDRERDNQRVRTIIFVFMSTVCLLSLVCRILIIVRKLVEHKYSVKNPDTNLMTRIRIHGIGWEKRDDTLAYHRAAFIHSRFIHD